MWFILGCGEHAVNTFPRETGQGASEKEGGLESLAGPVAQWQSTRLITGGAQVRILPGPPRLVFLSPATSEGAIRRRGVGQPETCRPWLLPHAMDTPRERIAFPTAAPASKLASPFPFPQGASPQVAAPPAASIRSPRRLPIFQ